MKKENKKVRRSQNYLTCNITNAERMSNKTYIADKASKKGVDVDEFKSYYVSKDAYKQLKETVQENGLEATADEYGTSKEVVKKWMWLNGRGTYKLPEVATEAEVPAEELEMVA